MKKTVSLLLIAVFTALIFTACGEAPLPEGVDKDEVERLSLQYVEYANNRDYNALADAFVTDMPYDDLLTELKDMDPYINSAGKFKEIKSIEAEGFNDDGVEGVICFVTCSYAKTKYNFFITYDTELNLMGFFLRTLY